MSDLTVSGPGVAFVERHEGVALRAYLCPAGVWTIGAGLTASSGVVTPRRGMVITREEARALLAQALASNYEPAVRVAMPGAVQREFDAGVSFHFNTGAIARASWVAAWRARDWAQVEQKIALWRESKGKVLVGLVRRRSEEFALLRWGVYEPAPVAEERNVVLPLSPTEIEELRTALLRLGHAAGETRGRIETAAIEAFQRAHDLTVDGLLGPATLSTLKRVLAARSRAQAGAVAAPMAAAAPAVPMADHAPVPVELGAVGVAVWSLWQAWRYRDVLAALVQPALPKTADLIRRSL